MQSRTGSLLGLALVVAAEVPGSIWAASPPTLTLSLNQI
jgi:hypothetical protein